MHFVCELAHEFKKKRPYSLFLLTTDFGMKVIKPCLSVSFSLKMKFVQATGIKLQATGIRLQATGIQLQATGIQLGE
jgi:hypothetical protein